MTSEVNATLPAPDRAPAAVPSPCIDICRMEAQGGLCEGCLRTLDEIAAWSQLPDAAKRAVWAAIELRRAQRSGMPGSAGSLGCPTGAASP